MRSEAMDKITVQEINPLDWIETQEDLNDLLFDCYCQDPDGVLASGVVECMYERYGVKEATTKIIAFIKDKFVPMTQVQSKTPAEAGTKTHSPTLVS